MTKQYEFDFSGLTIMDVCQVESGIKRIALCVLDKCTVGGVYELPAREEGPLWAQFFPALRAHLETIEDAPALPGVFDVPEIDDEAVRGMLDGIEGL